MMMVCMNMMIECDDESVYDGNVHDEKGDVDEICDVIEWWM